MPLNACCSPQLLVAASTLLQRFGGALQLASSLSLVLVFAALQWVLQPYCVPSLNKVSLPLFQTSNCRDESLW